VQDCLTVYGNFDRHDFILEVAAVLRRGSTAMAFQREAVELFLREVVIASDLLCAFELAEIFTRIDFLQGWGVGAAQARLLADEMVGHQWHARHAFGTRSNDDVHLPGHDGRGGKMQRLL
jgi:hypothetical protein